MLNVNPRKIQELIVTLALLLNGGESEITSRQLKSKVLNAPVF